MMSEPEQLWTRAVIRGVAEVMGETNEGLTHKQISGLLAELRIPDPLPSASKLDRLTEALVARFNVDRDPKRIITFITRAMEPVSYRDRPELFTLRQDGLNERLAFVGLRVNDEGKVAKGKKAQTLDQATKVATSIRDELRRRRTHPEVLKYCSVEVLKRSHFHACLEATKSIFSRIRQMTGELGDGASLIDATIAPGRSQSPRLQINSLATDTEVAEQKGFANLIKGLGGLYRNLTAHDPRLSRSISEEELLEVMTMISMVHRRLDGANQAA